MRTQSYRTLLAAWPASGRHVLAHFDSSTIQVYQAYRPAIAQYAVAHQQFGGEFSFERMSWIKPNFLWMMYRSGWARKVGQECILAVRLQRTFFDELLRASVPSSHADASGSHEEWQKAVKSSEVRRQWDPDHDPAGRALQRRAIQLGLRGATLRRYATSEVVAIADITPFVIEQRQRVADPDLLLMPQEQVYRPVAAIADHIGLDLDTR